MDSSDIHESINYVSSFGIILNAEEKAALLSSLVILKNEQKCLSVRFWGKVFGVKDNYYIAQAIGKDELTDKKTFYSLDCTRWSFLTPATRENRVKARNIRGRLAGDPAYDVEYFDRIPAPGEEPELPKTMKEEERLSAVIADIDEEVFIVPRRSYVQTPSGHVTVNRSFEGLTLPESSKLYNYLHFRDEAARAAEGKEAGAAAKDGRVIELSQLASHERSLDFLEPIENDLPHGAWSMQFERGSGLVLLASLLWPGYAFFHVPGTRKFGSVYFGIGEKNKDLPFMLP